MRDKRFVAEHRGGPLTKLQHRYLMAWARGCAEHVLPLMRDDIDDRLHHALAVCRQWERGEVKTGAAMEASHAGHAAASLYDDAVAKAVARSIAQAVATAHAADHSLGASIYALKAVRLADRSVDAERAWQDSQIPQDLRSLIEINRAVKEGSLSLEPTRKVAAPRVDHA